MVNDVQLQAARGLLPILHTNEYKQNSNLSDSLWPFAASQEKIYSLIVAAFYSIVAAQILPKIENVSYFDSGLKVRNKIL